jgi:haloacid dehalogenase superfamily, subfamily IA, variant 3 with third motif having DD or ED/haloacid dehalogenase superfamily, subfamily IA, variant 1 with third motif having Dx(3-4)D or Dx(3-4)E
MTDAPPRITAVVFDLGGVLIDWDPRYLYRKLMAEDEVEAFLSEIGFREWNHAQDAGGSWDEAVESLAARHPHRRDLIAAYPSRFAETLGGPIDESVALLDELRRRGMRVIGLTNWSNGTFPHARSTFGFLDDFEGIVVSGEEGVAKPDPTLFRILLDRYGLVPQETVFIDDAPANVAAAKALGLVALRFTDPARLRADLSRLGLLDGAGSD